MKFRKKPVVIEAFQWQCDFDALDVWLNSMGYQEDGDDDGGADGIRESDEQPECLVIPTLEGDHLAQRDDWIIRGVKGEFYPCKPEIFEMTYEPVEATPQEHGRESANLGRKQKFRHRSRVRENRQVDCR